jgi:hypothetical protein
MVLQLWRMVVPLTLFLAETTNVTGPSVHYFIRKHSVAFAAHLFHYLNKVFDCSKRSSEALKLWESSSV